MFHQIRQTHPFIVLSKVVFSLSFLSSALCFSMLRFSSICASWSSLTSRAAARPDSHFSLSRNSLPNMGCSESGSKRGSWAGLFSTWKRKEDKNSKSRKKTIIIKFKSRSVPPTLTLVWCLVASSCDSNIPRRKQTSEVLEVCYQGIDQSSRQH